MKLKKSFFLILLSSILLFTSFTVSAAPVSFEGPKLTYNSELITLGDFAVFHFMGNNRLDAVVPNKTYTSIVGLDNKDKWASITDNTYYDIHPYKRDGITPIQLIEGDFKKDGGKPSDLLVVSPRTLHVCKDYSGTTCPGFSAPMLSTLGSNWHAAVGKLKDKSDTIAVISQSGGNDGYLRVHETDATGEIKAAYFDQKIPEGAPFSLALGDYNSDGKIDIAVASRVYSTSPVVRIYVYLNNGASFDAPASAADFKYEVKGSLCYTPTGLLSFDLDKDSDPDLVLTCYDSKNASSISLGVVQLLQNDFATTKNFNHRFDIKNALVYPYSSAVGDFNKDGNFDVAVANYGAGQIRVYPGLKAFVTDPTGIPYSSPSFPISPAYIQVADKNADTWEDIIAVSTSVLPQPPSGNTPPTQGDGATNIFNLLMSEAYAASGPLYKDFITVFTEEGGLYSASPEQLKANYSSKTLANPKVSTIIYTGGVNQDNSFSRPIGGVPVSTSDAVVVLINTQKKIPPPATPLPECGNGIVDGSEACDIGTPPGSAADACAPAGGTCYPKGDPQQCTCKPKVVAPPPTIDCGDGIVNGSEACDIGTPPGSAADACAPAGGTCYPKGDPQQCTCKPKVVAPTPTPTPTTPTTPTIPTVPTVPGATPSPSPKTPPATTPQASATCPANELHFEVWVDDPFQMCVPLPGTNGSGAVSASGSSAYSVDFTQTSGPDMFVPAGMSSHLAAQTMVNGNCLTGRFAFPDNDFEVKGSYRIRNSLNGDTLAECPWRGNIKAALIEGSGRCSLSYGVVSYTQVFSMLSMLLMSLGSIYILRKQQK